jgi:hypothetical protein
LRIRGPGQTIAVASRDAYWEDRDERDLGPAARDPAAVSWAGERDEEANGERELGGIPPKPPQINVARKEAPAPEVAGAGASDRARDATRAVDRK